MPFVKAKPKILYIDDEPANRMVFERAFGRSFDLRCAETAEQGLLLLAEAPVAVLITDQRLPGMLGTELLAIAREQYPHTIRMVLTAYSDIEVVLRAINEGLASRYIIKPWVRPMLQEILTWGADMHAARVQLEEMQIKLIEGERLSTMGTLLASVAHDIKNPLGYIGAYIETFSDTVDRLQAWVGQLRAAPQLQAALRLPAAAEAIAEVEELPRVVRDLNQGLSHVYAIVEGIQLHSRRPSGLPQVSNPAVALDYATKLAKGLVSARGGTLNVEAEALPQIALSTAELSQVLVNLLTNAAHALDRHSSAPRQVRVLAERRGPTVRFEVRDSGQGMSDEVLARAFDEFFTTKPPGEGTGLGLPISRRIVEAAGGTLEVESVAGVGTTVSFSVPLAEVTPAGAPVAAVEASNRPVKPGGAAVDER